MIRFLAVVAASPPVSLAAVVAVLAAFAPIVWKAVDFVKFARAKDVNAVITQLVVWVAGIGVGFLARWSDFATGTALEHVNVSTVILAGLSIGSVASAAYDFKRARDNTDTAATPTLLPPSQAGVRPSPGITPT